MNLRMARSVSRNTEGVLHINCYTSQKEEKGGKKINPVFVLFLNKQKVLS